MIKCAWLTDIHLNFLEQEARMEFYRNLKTSDADLILISGDIAEAPTLIPLLEEMSVAIDKDIYFVVGNHDYYFGQIEQVNQQLISLTKRENKLYWLPATGPIHLTDDITLVGQDGWADGRLGDYTNSRVILNDSRLINDLFQQNILGKFKLLDKMQQLADIDAHLLRDNLVKALDNSPKRIIVLTHVPPFKETCLFNGEITNDDWLPFFTSKATGDVLYDFAVKNKGIELLVLCGHTHQHADVKILQNLTVKVGKAEYHLPDIQVLFEI